MAKTSIIIFPQPLSTATLEGIEGTTAFGDFTVSTEAKVSIGLNEATGSIADLGVFVEGNLQQPVSLTAAIASLGAIEAVTQGDVAPVITSTPSPSFIQGTADTYDMSQHWSDDGLSTVTSFLTPSALGAGLTYNTNTHVLTYDGVGATSSNSHTLTVQDAVGLDVSSSFPISVITASQITTVDIVGTGTGAVTFGHLFAEGDATAAQISGGQVNVKTTWPDGSLRFAVISGILDGGTTYSINSGASSGTNLTQAQLISALGTTTITLSGGVSGTINAANLISGAATPAAPGKISWQDGPYCIERIVGQQISGTVYGFFHCRYYSNGTLSVDFVVENCEAITAAANSIGSVNVTFTLNGSSVYSNSGITLYSNSRFMETAQNTGPSLRCKPDLAYFYSTKATLKYLAGTVDAGTSYVTSVSQNEIGNLRSAWGGTGDSEQIGPLPGWNVSCIRSGFDDHYSGVIANAKAVNHQGICYKDNAQGYPIDHRVHGTANINGSTGFDVPEGTGTSLSSDQKATHSPQEGYLAYILTGKYYFLETMWHLATNGLLQTPSNFAASLMQNPDLLVYLDDEQGRGAGWKMAHVGKAAFLAPDSHAYADIYETYIENVFNDLHTRYVDSGGAEHNPFGIHRDLHWNDPDFRVWMHDYANGAHLENYRMGFGGTNATAVATWLSAWSRKRISYLGNTDFCWQRGPGYSYGGQPPKPTGVGAYYADWAAYYSAVHGSASCSLSGDYDQSDTGYYYRHAGYPLVVCADLGFVTTTEWDRHIDGLPSAFFTLSSFDSGVDIPFGFDTRAASTAPTSTLGVAAAALSSGQSAAFGNNPPDAGLSAGVYYNWLARFLYDGVRQEIHFTGDYNFGNGNSLAHHLRYDIDTNAWTLVNSGFGGTTGHIYGNNGIDTTNGIVWLYQWNDTDLNFYDRGTDSWSTTASGAPISGGGTEGWGIAFHPNMYTEGALVIHHSTGIAAWDIDALSWNVLQTRSSGPPYYDTGMGIFHEGSNAVYLGGGKGGPVWRVDDDTTVTQLSATPIPVGGNATESSSPGHGVMLVNPNNANQFLVLERKGSLRKWVSSDCSNWTLSGTHGLSGCIAFCDIPDLGIVWGLDSGVSRIWKP